MARTIVLYTDGRSRNGVGRVNAALLEMVRDDGWRAVCVQPREDTPVQRRLAARGVEFAWIGYDPEEQPERFPTDTELPQRVFGAVRPDLALFSNGRPVAGFAGMRTAQALGIPYLVREGLVADGLLPDAPVSKASFAENYARASAVVTECRYQMDLIRGHFGFPEGFGHIIPIGVPDRFFAPRDEAVRRRLRRGIGVPDDAVLCFTAASFEPRKGYQFQVGAMAGLKDHPLWPRLWFAWAGEGPLRAGIARAMAEGGIGDHVALLGHRWDVADWLDAADVFVLPSHMEGTTNCILEAMAKGVPVLATPAGGIPEALGDVVEPLPPPDRPAQLVAGIARRLASWVSSPDERRRIGGAGRRRARALFTMERMTAAYRDLIDAALRSRL